MTDWTGKQVVIIGAARQGTALVRYLVRHGARVTLTDQRPAEQLQDALSSLAELPVRWACGGHPLEILDDCDLLCPSGGVPLELPFIVEAQRRGISLSNDSQIFIDAVYGKSEPCKVIGITGSAGKTTTTTLVGRMAQVALNHKQHAKCFVGGNIGNPLISIVDEITQNDIAVMELSSFQLEIMTCSPEVAAITNITPNHLDRHNSMAAYTAAKANIVNFQKEDHVAVLNHEDPVTWQLAKNGKVRGKMISFGMSPRFLDGSRHKGCTYLRENMLCWQDETGERKLFPRSSIRLRGEHNVRNALAACAITIAAGLPFEAAQAGIENFNGVPHRLEFVRTWGGAQWYNDSIATTPERAIADIRSFDEPLILLVGGRDKHLPWDDFAALARQRVKHLILFGEMAELVQAALIKAGLDNTDLTICAGLRDAVLNAAEKVTPGDVVLLSPGGTSFDEFYDFEARGESFRRWVNELA